MSGSSAPALTALDRMEIAEVIARWAAYEDTGQSQAWAGLFTADGVSTSASGKRLQGHEALAANQHARWTKPGGQDVAHWFAAPLIRATPEGAEASHYGVLVDREGGSVGTVSLRTYQMVREDGRWKIRSREIRHMPLGSDP